jgi:bifunctional enzyme CysN/CysC
MQKTQLNIVMVGHVDHGKSTLIGRLIYEMNALPDGKYEHILQSCEKRAMQFEWAYLMDALQAERAQNITIDITQFWLRTDTRDYVLIDAPGHHEFLRNMFTGAAEGDVGVLLVDAMEGMQEQTRKHAYLLHLLGVDKVIIAINKMDKVGYDEGCFKQLAHECESYIKQVGLNPLNIIPISAYHGDMLKQRAENMGWYEGATLVEALENVTPHASPVGSATPPQGGSNPPLRFCVQDVYRFDERRIIAGTIASGMLQVGDEILISPHNYQAQVASIINTDNENVAQAVAGEAIGITLTQQRFVERGHVISHFDNAPILSNQFYMRLFWLGAENLQHNKTYAIRLHNSILSAEVKQINYVLDTNDLTQSSNDFVAQNQVAEVLWQVRGLASFDEYHQIAAMGRAVVMSGDRIVAGGLLTMQNLPNLRSSPKIITSQNVTCENMEISAQKREARNGHKGGILWFTGLSGSGKSTLAKELQLQLFTRGYQVYVLDGDNVRQGLNADLGFSPKDRTENIRRIGEVASLFADAGMIVITAFISPYASDRRKARSAAPELFHVVHIKAGVEACEMRDVKGLYKKARAGEIGEFTGISAPYEVPVNPELVLDTESAMIDDCVAQLIAYVEKHFGKL